MMITQRAIAASALAVILLAADGCMAARAAGGGGRGRAMSQLRDKFAAADADHDGFLTREEAASGMPNVARHFDDIDAQHAGKVSLDQITQYLAAHRSEQRAAKSAE